MSRYGPSGRADRAAAIRRKREREKREHNKRYGYTNRKSSSKPLISNEELNEFNAGFWGCAGGIIKAIFYIIWKIISAPFKLMGKLYKSRAPLIVKIILTGVFVFFIMMVLGYIGSLMK